jgi:hypothetical protein
MQIPAWFVTQWDTAIRDLASQKVSRFEQYVLNRGQITGDTFTINNLDDVELAEKTTRFGDTEWSDIDHTARIVALHDFFGALPVDRADVAKIIANPIAGGQYMQKLVEANNRKKDAVIFQSFGADIVSKDGSTVFSLPADQKIAVGGTGFTKAKIIQARMLFRENEADGIDTGDQLCIAYDANMAAQILADPTLTSVDYLAGKMLQEGQIASSWLGFTWIPYNKLRKDGTNTYTYAWAASGIQLGYGYEEGSASARPDKQNAIQVAFAASYAAGRQDEKKVVEIGFQ